jgi:hypothetical protein
VASCRHRTCPGSRRVGRAAVLWKSTPAVLGALPALELSRGRFSAGDTRLEAAVALCSKGREDLPADAYLFPRPGKLPGCQRRSNLTTPPGENLTVRRGDELQVSLEDPRTRFARDHPSLARLVPGRVSPPRSSLGWGIWWCLPCTCSRTRIPACPFGLVPGRVRPPRSRIGVGIPCQPCLPLLAHADRWLPLGLVPGGELARPVVLWGVYSDVLGTQESSQPWNSSRGTLSAQATRLGAAGAFCLKAREHPCLARLVPARVSEESANT